MWQIPILCRKVSGGKPVLGARHSVAGLVIFLFGQNGGQCGFAVYRQRVSARCGFPRALFSVRFSPVTLYFRYRGGMLADRFGPRRVMALAIAWWSVFTSITGLVASYPILLVCRFVFGVGEGCFPGSSWKTIATYFPPAGKSHGDGDSRFGQYVGAGDCVVVAAGIIAAYGWRTVFVTLGYRD